MQTLARSLCLAPVALVAAITVAGCSSGSGMSAPASTAPPSTTAAASQVSWRWASEYLSTSPGDSVSALSPAAVGSSALAVGVGDRVHLDGAPETAGAEVLSLAPADLLTAATVGGIYQRSSNGWELVLDGPNGPTALTAANGRLYAFSDVRLDLYTQGTWTHHNGVLSAGNHPTAAAPHGGAVWVGGQTSSGPAFLAGGSVPAGFRSVSSPSFLCGPDEVQRVTDLLSADGVLYVAVGVFSRASDAPLRGELLMLDAGGQLLQLLPLQQDVPTALASLGGVVYVGTHSGRLLNNALRNAMGMVWEADPMLPANQGIHALLVHEGDLLVGAAGPNGALLLTGTPAAAPSSGGGGGGGAGSGFPPDVATALADCIGCHAWAGDLAEVTARVDTADPPNSALLLSATNAVPHGGGAIWSTTGNANYDAVLAWIQAGAPAGSGAAPSGGGGPGPNFVHTWPLVGAHAMADCTDCHGGGVFAGTPTDCASCHISDYNATTAPAHLASGYPTDCQRCHDTTQFVGASFTHTWPFTGQHANVAGTCNACHGDGVFAGRNTDCYGCHSQDVLQAAEPNHTAAGFGTDCQTCHTTDGFANNAPGFTHTWPFTGAHALIQSDCNRCHGDMVFAGKSNACFSCHAQDYAQAVPNHTASGFGTDCQTCHSTAMFQGATFNHRFPQNHKNANSCSDCHPNSANFRDFSCFACHGRNETDNEHRGRNGYSYSSPACVSCHPDGRD